MKRVIWAAKMAKAHDFIKNMKDVIKGCVGFKCR